MIPASIAQFIDAQAARVPGDHSDLRAVFINGTLKRSPAVSNTEGLIEVSARVNHLLDVAQANIGDAASTYVAEDAAAASTYGSAV